MFQHDLPFDRSSLTHWRHRQGAEQVATLLQEWPFSSTVEQAIEIKDLVRVVDHCQEKAITHPTEGQLTHHAIEKRWTRPSARRRRVAPRASCAWPSEPPSCALPPVQMRALRELARILRRPTWCLGSQNRRMPHGEVDLPFIVGNLASAATIQ